MSRKRECIPNIAGVWKYENTKLKNKNPNEKPSFSELSTRSKINRVEQDGNFVIVTTPPTPYDPGHYLIGVFTKVFANKTSFWQLTFAAPDDNAVQNLTIKKCKNGRPCIMSGNYIEAGFDTTNTNPGQVPTVAVTTWTRIE
jgi:hypothetical protein